MRVSPVGFAFDTENGVLREAQASAEVSRNHPEGIKGAQSAALAVFLARTGMENTFPIGLMSEFWKTILNRRHYRSSSG